MSINVSMQKYCHSIYPHNPIDEQPSHHDSGNEGQQSTMKMYNALPLLRKLCVCMLLFC